MATSRELRERRANVWSQMTEVIETAQREGRDLSAEEREKYDRAEAELDSLEGDIERQERHEQRKAELEQVDRSGVTGRQEVVTVIPDDETRSYADVFHRWMIDGTTDLDSEERALLRSGFVNDKEIRAQGTGNTAGGYTIPPAFRDQIIETMKYFGPMLQEAEIIRTDSGVNLPWPTLDDTANKGAILAENVQISEVDVVVGQGSLDAYMYTSKSVLASYQLLQDSNFVEDNLPRLLGTRIGRIWNDHFTTGTGTAQPDGIVTNANSFQGTGSFATTKGVEYDNVVDLVESLDPAYGNGNGLKFMGHQTVRKALRKLKDTQGHPLWETSMQTGTPDSLIGFPFLVNNSMATLAASSKSLLFGNIRDAYVIRVVRDIQMVRLNERYADFLQVGYFAFARADGTLQNANAVEVFQTTSTA